MAFKKLNKEQIIQLFVGACCLFLFFFFAGEKFLKSSSLKKLKDPKEVTNLSEKMSTPELLKLGRGQQNKNNIKEGLKEETNSSSSENILLSDPDLPEEELEAAKKQAKEISGKDSGDKGTGSVTFPNQLKHEEVALETRLEEMRNNTASLGGLSKDLLNTLLIEDSDNEPLNLSSKDVEKENVNGKNFKVVNKSSSNVLEKPFANLLRESEEKASPENLQHKKYISALLKRLYTLKGVEQLKVGAILREDVKESDATLISQLLKQGVRDTTTKLFLIDALAKTKSKTAVETLIFEYENSQERGRIATTSALSKIGTRKAELFLYDVISGKVRVTNNVLQSAYAALARMDTTSSRQMLESLERSKGIKKNSANYHALQSALSYARKKSNKTKIDMGIPGGSKLTLNYKGSEYLFYHPALRDEVSDKPWLFICVHGGDLAVKDLFNSCVEAVRGKNFAVLTPVFDTFNFPDYGNLDHLSRGVRSYQRFWEIVDHVSKVAKLQIREMYIYGTEKGGDFVSRIVLTSPTRFAKAVSYNAVLPVPSKVSPLPEGVQPSPLLPELKVDLNSFVKTDFLALRPDKNPRDGKLFFNWLERISRRTGRAVRPKIEKVKLQNDAKLNSRAREFIFGK